MSQSQIVAFFYQVLLAVGVLEQNCCNIFDNYGSKSHVTKTP